MWPISNFGMFTAVLVFLSLYRSMLRHYLQINHGRLLPHPLPACHPHSLPVGFICFWRHCTIMLVCEDHKVKFEDSNKMSKVQLTLTQTGSLAGQACWGQKVSWNCQIIFKDWALFFSCPCISGDSFHLHFLEQTKLHRRNCTQNYFLFSPFLSSRMMLVSHSSRYIIKYTVSIIFFSYVFCLLFSV